MNKIAKCSFLGIGLGNVTLGAKQYEYLVPDYLDVAVGDIVAVSTMGVLNHSLCIVQKVIPFSDGEYEGETYEYVVSVIDTTRFKAEQARRKAAKRIASRLKQLRKEYADMIEIEKLAAVMPEAQRLLDELKSLSNAASHGPANTTMDNANAEEEQKG